MPEFKNREEYNKWKAERAKELEEKKKTEYVKQLNKKPMNSNAKQEKQSMDRLINCPTCGNEVSKNALTCPQCGEPTGIEKAISKTKSKLVAGLIILALIALIAIPLGFLRIYYGEVTGIKFVAKKFRV